MVLCRASPITYGRFLSPLNPPMPQWIERASPIAQIVLSILLIGMILLQSKGSGLSGVFGGEGNVYRTKRGAERVIFIATIVVAILFFGVALVNLFRK